MSVIKRKHTNKEGLFFYDFLSEKESSGLSKKTLQNYLESYLRFKREVGKAINEDSIKEWTIKMLSESMNAISINYYLRHIKVFVNWLSRKGLIEKIKIDTLRNQESQLKIVTDNELEVLCERPTHSKSFAYFRSWAIICFIMATGARASTLLNIKMNDFDFIQKEIRYTHLKNKTFAIVPMSNALMMVLKYYLGIWEIKSDYLFPDAKGNKLTLNGLSLSLRRYCISKNQMPHGPHAFRHTFAKKFILNGGSAFALQRFLTHSDLTMTKKYVRLFDADLKIGFQELCPLDNCKKNFTINKR